MTIRLSLDGTMHLLGIVGRRPELVVSIDGKKHSVAEEAGRNGERIVVVNGRPISFAAVQDHNVVLLHIEGRTFRIEVPDPSESFVAGGTAADEIAAPMPGTVVSIALKPGDRVAAGDPVLVIESMKLQMNLTAQRAGTIAKILVAPNETFDRGAVLARLEPEKAD